MAKRKVEQEESQRQSRKEILLARRQAQQARNVKIVVAIVGLLIALVLGVAIVNEYVIVPGQPVAAVGDEQITLREWQNRVRYQRAQFIITLEDQLEQFGDLGLVQQFNQQQIQYLVEGEELGRLVLEQMIDEVVARQLAEERGISVTEEEVDEAIAERFNYFAGATPTPQPTPTETIVPTPSITPIPTEVITDVLPTQTPLPTATTGPTPTPFPTATPVSAEAFEEQLQDQLARFRDMGVSEDAYRSVFRANLYQEKLAEVLAEEEELETEAPHVSFYVTSFGTEEEAEEAQEQIEEEGFLTVWNTIRSMPADPEAERPPTATEFLWRTREQVETTYTEEIADALFEVELDTPTEILEVPGESEEQPSRFYIYVVNGRETRELPEATLESQQAQLVADAVQQRRAEVNAQTFPLWNTRVPRTPILDPSFLVQPTPPPQPTVIEPTLLAPTPETPEPTEAAPAEDE